MKKFLSARVLGLVSLVFLMSANDACDKGKNKDSNVLSKENETNATCQTDADCIVTKADCCGCSNGGKQIVLHKNELKNWQEKISLNCGDKVCIQMISNDPSCKMKSACENEQCKLK